MRIPINLKSISLGTMPLSKAAEVNTFYTKLSVQLYNFFDLHSTHYFLPFPKVSQCGARTSDRGHIPMGDTTDVVSIDAVKDH